MATPGAIPGLVDMDAAMSITTQQIVAHVQACVDESKRVREPLEGEWRKYTDLYLNRHGFDAPEKADWQANIFLPVIFNKVETAKSMVRGALLDSDKWFVLDEYPQWRVLSRNVRFTERLLRYELEHANFVHEYMMALEEGFLLGTGVLKLWWDDWVERTPKMVDVPLYSDPMQMQMAQYFGQPTTRPEVQVQPRLRNALRCAQVPLQAMYPDPFARTFDECKYVIEECAIDDEDLHEGIRAGKYDSAADVGSPVAFDLETETRQQMTGLGYDTRSPRRKRHLLQIYHGNLYSRDGNLALENWRVIVCNKRAVISVAPNALFSGKRPYIWSTPLPVRGRLWGRSMVAAASSMQIELNNLTNQILDATTISVLPAVTVNTAMMDDPSEIDSLTPGMAYRVNRNDAIQPIKVASTPNDVWPVVSMLENKIDESTISGLFSGQPTNKGRPTATEISSVMQSGQSKVQNLAKSLETNDLNQAVQLAYELTLQFLTDTSDPDLQAIIQDEGGPIELANQEVRFRMLGTPFKVQARGISAWLGREAQAGKMMQLMQLGMQIGLPPGDNLQTFYKLAEVIGVDPREIGQPESPEELQMKIQQMMMMQQQQAGAGSGGGSGMSRDVPPEPPSTPTGPPQPNSPQMLMNQVQNMGPPMPGG